MNNKMTTEDSQKNNTIEQYHGEGKFLKEFLDFTAAAVVISCKTIWNTTSYLVTTAYGFVEDESGKTETLPRDPGRSIASEFEPGHSLSDALYALCAMFVPGTDEHTIVDADEYISSNSDDEPDDFVFVSGEN
ncbi:MAG: hypothetical protein P8P83_05595 [Rickettsiaceae bacterium]|nr:hypothetical protein [Rickettsiaceae bacterium]